MITEREHIEKVRKVAFLFLLASAMGFMFVALGLQSTAFANTGADSGRYEPNYGGGGSGGCLVTGWKFTRGLNAIKRDSTAAGNLCGSPNGNILQAVRRVGANGCANNSKDVVAVWWIHDSAKSWATSNGAGQDLNLQTAEATRSIIDDTPNRMLKKPNGKEHFYRDKDSDEKIIIPPSAIKNTARNAVANGSTHNVIVCFWTDPRQIIIQRCRNHPDWGNFVAARPGSKKVRSMAHADSICFERCPATSTKHPNERIPKSVRPKDRFSYCTEPPNNGDTWEEFAYASDLGYELNHSDFAGGVQPYFYQTQVSDGGVTVPGQTLFVPEVAFERSAFADFFDSWCEDETGCVFADEELGNDSEWLEEFREAYRAVVEEVEVESHASLDLTDSNMVALAEGRVMNVGDYIMYADARVGEVVDPLYKRVCTRHYDYDYDAETETWILVSTWVTCTEWELAPSDEGDLHFAGGQFSVSSTYELSKVYQVLTNHCNARGFNLATNGLGVGGPSQSGVADSGDNSRYYSATAVSQTFDTAEELPWGLLDPTGITDKPRFFDRLCSFEGKLSDPQTQLATNERKPDDHTFFRDGEWEKLELNYFTPRNFGVVRYEGTEPLSTHLLRDPTGTPKLTYMNFRGVNSQGAKSDELFGNEAGTVPVQRQWETERAYRGLNVALMPSGYSTFEARGVWASERDQPQVINVRWKFEAQLALTTAGANVGFASPRGRMSWDPVTQEVPLRGMIEGVNNGALSLSNSLLKEALTNSTGSQSVAEMDVPLYFGHDKDPVSNRWQTRPSRFDPHYYSVRWVRAVGE